MPALTTPVLEAIVAKIVSALQNITAAHGYNTTVASVYRPATVADYGRTPPGNYVVQLTLSDPAREADNDRQGNPARIGWRQPVQLDLLYRPSDTATTAIELALNTFYADVVKALMANPQWDGLALDTQPQPPQYIITAEGAVGVTLPVDVLYIVRENDPYQQ